MKRLAQSAALLLMLSTIGPTVYVQAQNADQKKAAQKQRELMGEWLRQHAQLPLDQQRQALQSDPDYKRLNPNQQQQLMNRLQQFDSKPPEERQRLARRFEALEHMSPDDRQQLREANQQRQQLPPDRRREVNRAYNFLRELPPQEQSARLESPAFHQRFSEYERNILRGLLKAPQIDPRLGTEQ